MMIVDEARDVQRIRQRVSILIPILFVLVLWLIQVLQWGLNLDFGVFGIFPRTFSGLDGIVFSPLIHGGWGHLASNTIPLLVLGFLMIYFYRNVAYRVILFIWLLDGIGVWLIGRGAYHIGASGIVYGMASFLFFSGILRKSRQLLALSLAVVFIYGGMIWGMFPYVTDISWEAHLVGFLAGIFFAVYYRQKGPPDDVVPEWMIEEEKENEAESQPGSNGENKEIKINYIFIPKEKDDDKKN